RLPRIDAGGLSAGDNGLRLRSGDNVVHHLVVLGSPNNDFLVDGNGNSLLGVYAWNAGGDGIDMTGDANTVGLSFIGVRDPVLFSSCGAGSTNAGNNAAGVRIESGAAGNAVRHS